MRVIKFRAKSVQNNLWIVGDLIHKRHRGDEEVIIQESNGCGTDCMLRTVGQFTGLKDKNGKEIFEGDIVRWEKDNLLYVVMFRSGLFYASIKSLNEGVYGGFPLWVLCEEECSCVIIGNIYDYIKTNEL